MPLLFKPDTVRIRKGDGTNIVIDGMMYGMDASVAFYMTDRVPDAPNIFMCDIEDYPNFTVNDRVEYIQHNGQLKSPVEVYRVAKTPKKFPADDTTSSCNVFLSEEGFTV